MTNNKRLNSNLFTDEIFIEVIKKMLVEAKKRKFSGYDPFFWQSVFSKYGVKLQEKIGAILDFIAPPYLLKPMSFPTADARFMIAALRVYKITGENVFKRIYSHLLSRIKKVAKESVFYGWGLPFSINVYGYWYKPNTPFSTTTPLVTNALIEAYWLTLDSNLLRISNKALVALIDNLNEIRLDKKRVIYSYGIHDTAKVINSNALLAGNMVQIGSLTGNTELLKQGASIIKFICEYQTDSGFWNYKFGDDSSFDTFHNLYIIQNLYKANKVINGKKIYKKVKLAMSFILRETIRRDGSIAHYYNKDAPYFVDSQDVGELIKTVAITGYSHKNLILFEKWVKNTFMIDRYPYIHSRFIKFGPLIVKYNIPYIRWAMGPFVDGVSQILLNRESNLLAM